MLAESFDVEAPAPVLARVAVAGAFAPNGTHSQAKSTQVEFSPALDLMMADLVRSAADSDNCAEALAAYGRLPPAVLVAGAKVALANCRTASLEALHAHGLSANDMLQAISLVDLHAVFAKTPTEQILAVLKTTAAIMPQMNYLQKAACTHAFLRGDIAVLSCLDERVPHDCERGTMQRLAEKEGITETLFCSIYARWMRQNRQWPGVTVAEIDAVVGRNWRQATLMLLGGRTGGGQRWSPALGLRAAFHAIRKEAVDVLDAVVAAGPLETNSYSEKENYWQQWAQAFEESKSMERVAAALVVAAQKFPSSQGLAIIARGLLARMPYSSHAFDALCHPEFVMFAVTPQNHDFRDALWSTFEHAPKSNFLTFFSVYGEWLRFSPTATEAPEAATICSLIGVGADPRIFELLPSHVCHMEMIAGRYLEQTKSVYLPVLLPVNQAVPPSDVCLALESFYRHGTCVQFPQFVTVIVSALFTRGHEPAELTGALARIARICPTESWDRAWILKYLIAKSHRGSALFCSQYMRPTDALESFLHLAVECKNALCFEVLAGMAALSPTLASELLLFAHISNAPEIQTICRRYSGVLAKLDHLTVSKRVESWGIRVGNLGINLYFIWSSLSEKQWAVVWKELSRREKRARAAATEAGEKRAGFGAGFGAGSGASSAGACVLL